MHSLVWFRHHLWCPFRVCSSPGRRRAPLLSETRAAIRDENGETIVARIVVGAGGADMFARLRCCQTDDNVYESDGSSSSSGDELGGGSAQAAVIRWPQQGPAASDPMFLSHGGAGSIRVLPSSTRHTTSRHRKSDSVAVLPSEPPPSRGPGGCGEEKGSNPVALGGVSKGWAASLVSSCDFLITIHDTP